MIIYILEWGIDIRCSSAVQFANTIVFPTIEDACSKAMEYKDNIPNILKYDLENRKVIKEYTNIPELDAKISAL